MSDRYFVETPIAGDQAILAGLEAHHLIHVMRAKPGAEVTLFDGSGSQFVARVERVRRAEVELTIISREQIDRELPRPLVLGVTLPKGDRQKWLVEKAVELGTSRIVPLETARSVAKPVEQALERLRRTVIEASKQCGRNRLMEIAEPQRWDEFVKAGGGQLRLLAHPKVVGLAPPFSPLLRAACGTMGEGQGVRALSGAEIGQSIPTFASPHPNPLPTNLRSVPGEGTVNPSTRRSQAGTMLAVGPEGGFTDEEVALAVANGWQLVDLGPRILRIETAALALAAMIASQSDPSRASWQSP
jgi:16S rRNA (uracil1498-N3)-methyltransferase